VRTDGDERVDPRSRITLSCPVINAPNQEDSGDIQPQLGISKAGDTMPRWPVGLALAIDLAQRGIEVAVAETRASVTTAACGCTEHY
jgi:hypothetical protein